MKRVTVHTRRGLVVLMLVWLLGSSALTGWLLYQRFQQTNRNRVANAHIWHAVVCDIESSVVKNQRREKLANSDLNQFLDFYDHLLVADAHAQPCGLPRRPA